MSQLYRTGQIVPVSGIYTVIGADGTALARIPLARAGRFPPFRWQSQTFRLHREVVAKYTVVASAAVMDETTIQFRGALERLAKR